jgi:DNA-binding IclR family transcriptional regulator
LDNTRHDPEDRHFATTLAKGMELLRCFTPVKPLLGNNELSQRTGMSRPTISRFTYTLCKLGYLCIDPDTRKYALGPAVVSLGYPLLASIALRQTARPWMNQLAQELRCSVSMGVRDRLNMVYVETSRSQPAWTPQLSDIGLRYPIASTAIGHAYVASCDAETRHAVLNEIQIYAPLSWNRFSSQLLAAPTELANQGYCVSWGQQHPDYWAVAVPYGRVLNFDMVVFNAVVHHTMTTREQLEQLYAPRLMEMIQRLKGQSPTSAD